MWTAAIWDVLVCRHWCVIVEKIFIVKLYSHKIFSFSVYENIFTTKKSIGLDLHKKQPCIEGDSTVSWLFCIIMVIVNLWIFSHVSDLNMGRHLKGKGG